MNPTDFLATVTGAERDVIHCLFLNGPTWDGNIPSKEARDRLCKRGLVQHEFGWAWLTRAGMMMALQALQLDVVKDKRK